MPFNSECRHDFVAQARAINEGNCPCCLLLEVDALGKAFVSRGDNVSLLQEVVASLDVDKENLRRQLDDIKQVLYVVQDAIEKYFEVNT